MVRQRGGSNSLKDPEPPIKAKHRKKSSGGSRMSNIPKSVKILILLSTVSISLYMAYKGYLETRVNQPLSVPKAVSKTGLAVPSLFWGSYRSGVYFGLKTRTPSDLLTGLMWMLPEKIDPQNLGLRHWCEQGDNLDSFGWKQHDGRNFGIQKISDRGVQLTTSFLKWSDGSPDRAGLEWSARISAETKNKKKSGESISLFFYAGLDDGCQGDLEPVFSHSGEVMTGISGRTENLGRFQMNFFATNGTQINVKQIFHSAAESPGPYKFTETVMQRLRMYKTEQTAASLPIIGLDPNHLKSDRPNFVVFQVNAVMPFQLDVRFTLQDSLNDLTTTRGEDEYTKALDAWSQNFVRKFEKQFKLKEKGYDDQSIEFAQSALSNLIGGIGYFYGHSIVKTELTDQPVKYWDAPLYTAVPSRSFFPRGFLWDEGFHNLLISKWDVEISADILAHWMDLINVEGWIPREQILGLEARAKVPSEFVIQNNKNANPPTLILTLHSIVNQIQGQDGFAIPDWFREYLLRMWPRLEVWYKWFNTTQTGPIPGTYRWRGRNGSAIHELNPKTLTSGLDDFPRASHPSDDERHIDLRCWMALGSSLMADIARILGMDKETSKYEATSNFLKDNQILDSAHWSESHGAYLDYGLHTEGVSLERPRVQPGQNSDKQRAVKLDPKLQFVNQFGYVGLFPFLVQIVDPESPKLAKILSDIENPQKLFTPFGLRSLSKQASLYMKKNTEHDAPYWRGPIWININYLAVRALHHYSTQAGPHQADAKRIYLKLRDAVIKNVIKEYLRTGYIWEQYNDKTGQGQGCRPFTGWSTLVVLMMGESY